MLWRRILFYFDSLAAREFDIIQHICMFYFMLCVVYLYWEEKLIWEHLS